MPTIKIQWWLGNQMFQYALAYALSKKNNENIVFDPSYLENRFIFANWTFRSFELDVFGIEKNYDSPNAFMRKYIHPRGIETLRSFQFGNRYIREVWGKFIEDFPKDAYLDGWFQSFRYFENYRDAIQEIFTVKTPISEENARILSMIESSNNTAISLHVRRGDYVTLDSANKWHGVCSLWYYESAINLMREKIENPVFFVFSDDIMWCKENILLPEWVEVIYVDHNGSAWHEDLRLMYSCSHHILANSSFSWWWAYLGRNPEKIIIAPKKWLQTDAFSTQNLLPPSWILL
jgi:hypothetical protein